MSVPMVRTKSSARVRKGAREKETTNDRDTECKDSNRLPCSAKKIAPEDSSVLSRHDPGVILQIPTRHCDVNQSVTSMACDEIWMWDERVEDTKPEAVPEIRPQGMPKRSSSIPTLNGHSRNTGHRASPTTTAALPKTAPAHPSDRSRLGNAKGRTQRRNTKTHKQSPRRLEASGDIGSKSGPSPPLVQRRPDWAERHTGEVYTHQPLQPPASPGESEEVAHYRLGDERLSSKDAIRPKRVTPKLRKTCAILDDGDVHRFPRGNEATTEFCLHVDKPRKTSRSALRAQLDNIGSSNSRPVKLKMRRRRGLVETVTGLVGCQPIPQLASACDKYRGTHVDTRPENHQLDGVWANKNIDINIDARPVGPKGGVADNNLGNNNIAEKRVYAGGVKSGTKAGHSSAVDMIGEVNTEAEARGGECIYPLHAVSNHSHAPVRVAGPEDRGGDQPSYSAGQTPVDSRLPTTPTDTTTGTSSGEVWKGFPPECQTHRTQSTGRVVCSEVTRPCSVAQPSLTSCQSPVRTSTGDNDNNVFVSVSPDLPRTECDGREGRGVTATRGHGAVASVAGQPTPLSPMPVYPRIPPDHNIVSDRASTSDVAREHLLVRVNFSSTPVQSRDWNSIPEHRGGTRTGDGVCESDSELVQDFPAGPSPTLLKEVETVTKDEFPTVLGISGVDVLQDSESERTCHAGGGKAPGGGEVNPCRDTKHFIALSEPYPPVSPALHVTAGDDEERGGNRHRHGVRKCSGNNVQLHRHNDSRDVTAQRADYFHSTPAVTIASTVGKLGSIPVTPTVISRATSSENSALSGQSSVTNAQRSDHISSVDTKRLHCDRDGTASTELQRGKTKRNTKGKQSKSVRSLTDSHSSAPARHCVSRKDRSPSAKTFIPKRQRATRASSDVCSNTAKGAVDVLGVSTCTRRSCSGTKEGGKCMDKEGEDHSSERLSTPVPVHHHNAHTLSVVDSDNYGDDHDSTVHASVTHDQDFSEADVTTRIDAKELVQGWASHLCVSEVDDALRSGQAHNHGAIEDPDVLVLKGHSREGM